MDDEKGIIIMVSCLNLRRRELSSGLGPVAGLLAAALVVGCATTHETRFAGTDGREEKPDSPIEAAMYRYQQRLSEGGVMPDDALMNAKAQRDAMIFNQGLGGGIDPETWTWIGPGNIGGRIRPIVIDPSDPNVIYVGSASGGIWKTTNGGALWEPLDDFMASLAVGCMAMDPEDPNTLYAGTGEGFFETIEGSSNTAAVRGAGIFKSVDAGLSWQQLPSTDNSNFHFVNRIAISPADSDTLLAGTGSGIWRSTDGGATWTQRSTFEALDVRFHPTDASLAVAGGHHAVNGPMYSTDGGLTWLQSSGAGGHRQELCYAASSPSTVYAAVSNDSGSIRIWRSTDGGQTYTLRTSGNGISTYASYNNTLWVDPTNANFLIVGGVYYYASSDGGQSLSQRFNSVHPDMHGIVNHPGFNGSTNRTVYFGTDGGIYRTTDAYASSATSLNNNLGITQFYGAAINPISGVVVGGTQDNGTLRYSGNPQAWTATFGADGGHAATDPTDANYFYGEIQNARVFRSSNAGVSASYIYSGISDAGGLSTNFITQFILDPNEPNRMLVACRRLWRTNNARTGNPPTWAVIKSSLGPDDPENPKSPGGSHFAGNDPRNLSTVAVAPGNSDVIWVGHNNGEVWKTSNGTVISPSWTRVDENDGGLPNRWVGRIAIDPSNHDRVTVAFMGWEGDNLWRTEDGGQTWTDITGSGVTGLPDVPISALTLHPTRAGWIYVGTDIGVFTSRNDGQTWTTSTQGPGTVSVEELHWKNASTLFAVTHGRGAYLAAVSLPADLIKITMIRGSILSGDVGSLAESNDQSLRTLSGFGQSLTDLHSMETRIDAATDVDSPASLDVTVEARIDEPSGVSRLRLKNWNTTQFDTVATYGIGNTDAAFTVPDLDATDYVSDTGEIQLAIRHVVVVPVFVFTFESFIDWVEFTVD